MGSGAAGELVGYSYSTLCSKFTLCSTLHIPSMFSFRLEPPHPKSCSTTATRIVAPPLFMISMELLPRGESKLAAYRYCKVPKSIFTIKVVLSQNVMKILKIGHLTMSDAVK